MMCKSGERAPPSIIIQFKPKRDTRVPLPEQARWWWSSIVVVVVVDPKGFVGAPRQSILHAFGLAQARAVTPVVERPFEQVAFPVHPLVEIHETAG